MRNYRLLRISVRHAVVKMRMANAIAEDFAISCTFGLPPRNWCPPYGRDKGWKDDRTRLRRTVGWVVGSQVSEKGVVDAVRARDAAETVGRTGGQGNEGCVVISCEGMYLDTTS